MYNHAESMAAILEDPMLERDWYKPAEFAKEVGVTDACVYDWLENGWLFGLRKPKESGDMLSDLHAHWRIPQEELARIKSYTMRHPDVLVKFAPRVIRENRNGR